jgi:hypothetical protein
MEAISLFTHVIVLFILILLLWPSHSLQYFKFVEEPIFDDSNSNVSNDNDFSNTNVYLNENDNL